ncbi:retrovirus-related pol polyprotein from transposon TNT 1-94 [Tanacetum coccineum]
MLLSTLHTLWMIIFLEREINPRNSQHAFKRCEACGSLTHTTTDHYDIEWFKRGEALQAKKTKALKSTRAESSNANRSNTSTKRHMTGVKSYLYKYMEQPGPKVVFGDDSTCVTEGYGSIKCNGIVFTKVAFVNGLKYNLISISQLCDAKYIVQFDEKRGKFFNSNKEIVMISPRVRGVYVLDITSSAQESCFFAKYSENLNWLWQKRLAHLNFRTINKLAKQNLVIGLPSLVYSKDKPCSSCEKGKHHMANLKKQTSSIKKCLHLLHVDLFRPVTPRSINHEKCSLVIIDEYSRYTWVYFLKKKSQAPENIMSFIKRVENQNDIKLKQLRTDNESSTQEDSKLNKPITSHLMKALMLSNSQNLQLTTSTLLKMKDINLMNIFILMSLLKVIMDYLVNISKRHALWDLNEDILKITVLTTNTPYPSRKIWRIRACTHQRPQRKQYQYAVSNEDQYAVLEI